MEEPHGRVGIGIGGPTTFLPPAAPLVPPSQDNQQPGPPGGKDLFQWGATDMEHWADEGYNTTNAGYGLHYTQEEATSWMKDQANNNMEYKKRELMTPWGTSNAAYGKGVVKRALSDSNSYRFTSPAVGVSGSFASIRPQPLYLNQPGGGGGGGGGGLGRGGASNLLSPAQKREALEGKLNQVVSGKTYQDTGFSLPPLDRSKYLVAQGPPPGFVQTSSGYTRATQKPKPPLLPGDPNSAPVTAGQNGNPPPPKTGPARKYMRDTLDRFLNSIPEHLRPKTRKAVKPREPAQILKIKTAKKSKKKEKSAVLPARSNDSALSHAVPSVSSSSLTSSRSSSPEEELIDLNDSMYNFNKEEKN